MREQKRVERNKCTNVMNGNDWDFGLIKWKREVTIANDVSFEEFV